MLKRMVETEEDLTKYLVHGPQGSVQFVLYTSPISGLILPWDLGYHSPKPMWEGQEMLGPCKYLEMNCYYDGSTLNADRVYQLMLAQGESAMWAEVEDYYNNVFNRSNS